MTVHYIFKNIHANLSQCLVPRIMWLRGWVLSHFHSESFSWTHQFKVMKMLHNKIHRNFVNISDTLLINLTSNTNHILSDSMHSINLVPCNKWPVHLCEVTHNCCVLFKACGSRQMYSEKCTGGCHKGARRHNFCLNK